MIRAALLASALLATPALAQQALTGSEITALLSDATVEGSMLESGEYAEYYAPDGVIRSADYTGEWSVEGDAMCFKYGEEAATCWDVAATGNQIEWIIDGVVQGTGVVRPGNPNDF